MLAAARTAKPERSTQRSRPAAESHCIAAFACSGGGGGSGAVRARVVLSMASSAARPTVSEVRTPAPASSARS